MIITYSVSITDIIQAVGVFLGIPVAIWGIFQLFIKDKDKAKQLKALEGIALSQNTAIGKMTEQITELSKQTSQFEFQSFLLKESNDLLKEQIQIQTDAIINDKDHKKKSLDLDIKKRKLEIRPFLKISGGSSGPNYMGLPMINYGERAYFDGIEQVDTLNINISPSLKESCIIEKNGIWRFY